MPYVPALWFWIVGGDETHAWSGGAAAYVSEWPGDRVTRIDTEANLTDVLRAHGMRGPVVAAVDVDAERDRRIAEGFEFAGALFQSRPEDQKRIAGAATLAVIAAISGAQPGNLRWHGGDSDFAWIASDNSLVTMDAATVLQFGAVAANWEAAHIYAARSLKDQSPIPGDFADDSKWPQAL